MVVYGDASGASMNTTGYSDYQVIRGYFGGKLVKGCLPGSRKANPPVRDRVQLVNARLRNSPEMKRQLFIDPKCKELIADFEQVSYQEESNSRWIRTRIGGARIYRMRWGYLIWQEDRNQEPSGNAGRGYFDD